MIVLGAIVLAPVWSLKTDARIRQHLLGGTMASVRLHRTSKNDPALIIVRDYKVVGQNVSQFFKFIAIFAAITRGT